MTFARHYPPLALLLLWGCDLVDRDTPARPAPWVEFIRLEGATGWIDTTGVLGSHGSPARVNLHMDYADPTPFPTDSSVLYSRMEWIVELDCVKGTMSDQGMSLRDSAGDTVVAWPARNKETAISEHGSGKVLPRACQRLQQLGRVPTD